MYCHPIYKVDSAVISIPLNIIFQLLNINKMNEKEKALELVKYFFSRIIRDKKKVIAIPLADAKEYALRMVDEVLKQQPYDVYTIEQCDNVNRYWANVKKEICYL